jgi:hypothetical protein
MNGRSRNVQLKKPWVKKPRKKQDNQKFFLAFTQTPNQLNYTLKPALQSQLGVWAEHENKTNVTKMLRKPYKNLRTFACGTFHTS